MYPNSSNWFQNPTSSQATIFTHCPSHVQRLVQTSPCAQQPTQAEGAGGCATLCPCRQCPLAQCCPSICLTWSQSQLHPLKAAANLTPFSPFPISDPTQLGLCSYRWLLLTRVLNLALIFFLLNPSLVLIW